MAASKHWIALLFAVIFTILLPKIVYAGSTWHVASSDALNSISANRDKNLDILAEQMTNLTLSHNSATTARRASTANSALTTLLISTTTIISSVVPEPSAVGQPITVTFMVTAMQATPTGVVTVTVEGEATSCNGPLTNGIGSCVLVFQNEGSFSLIASFGGDDIHQPSSGSALHIVRQFKAYLPVIYTLPFLVTGQVTHNGKSVAGVQLFLAPTPSTNDDELSTTTDSEGKYYFWVVDNEIVNRNPLWQVTFRNPTRNSDFLDFWETFHLQASEPTPKILTIPTFDLGALQLASPKANARKDMPIDFTWKKRKTPGINETYQVWFVDNNGRIASGAVWPYPTEKETMDCIRYNGQIDLENGDWFVEVRTDVGLGHSFNRRLTIGKTLTCPSSSGFMLQK